MRRSKPALTAGFCLPAAPRPAVCPVSVAPNAYACPAAGRLRRNRVVIWSRVVRVGITPAPTIAEPKSKPESGTPAAAPASMPVAAIPARLRTARHEYKETENQNCACEKSCQPRNCCTSGAASPLRQANSIPPPCRPLFPPAAHLRHDHRAADAVFLRKPRAALPLGIRPRVDAARIDCDARAFFLRREFSRTVCRGFVIANGWSGRRRYPSAGAENKYQADQGQPYSNVRHRPLAPRVRVANRCASGGSPSTAWTACKPRLQHCHDWPIPRLARIGGAVDVGYRGPCVGGVRASSGALPQSL